MHLYKVTIVTRNNSEVFVKNTFKILKYGLYIKKTVYLFFYIIIITVAFRPFRDLVECGRRHLWSVEGD